MGKLGRWLRNLFLPGWKSRKAKDRGAADADCRSVLSAPLPAAPSGREKRRCSFRRPGAGASGGQGPLASSSSHCFSEAEVHVVVVAQEQDQDQQQQLAATAAVVVPEAKPSTAGTVVVPLPAASGRRSGGRDGEAAAAAVKIQAALRSYLEAAERGSEENDVRIVEVDDGAAEQQLLPPLLVVVDVDGSTASSGIFSVHSAWSTVPLYRRALLRTIFSILVL